MSFLADENFPRPAVHLLRENSFDVVWVQEDNPGSSDEAILARCASEKRTLLTLDKDFGELVFHRRLPSECGVILFRADSGSPSELAEVALAALQSRDDWSGFFTVVSRSRVRMIPVRRA